MGTNMVSKRALENCAIHYRTQRGRETTLATSTITTKATTNVGILSVYI